VHADAGQGHDRAVERIPALTPAHPAPIIPPPSSLKPPRPAVGRSGGARRMGHAMVRWLLCFGALVAATAPARSQLGEITVAPQYGVTFLPLMVMEHSGLIEKHAAAAGAAVKVNWVKVAGPSVMNDGLLSGTMHFAAQGAPSLITLWDKTRTGVG